MVQVTKKCKKCLEAENIPLTYLLFYILKILDPYRFKSSHLTMQVSTIKKCGMYLQIKVKILILSQLIHYLYCRLKRVKLVVFRHSELFWGFLNILSVFEQCAVALKWTRTTMSREPNKSANREVHQRCHAMS